MAKTTADVVNVLKLRGVIDDAAELSAESYAEQAAEQIKSYCNIPIVPDGAFYAWVDITAQLIKGADGRAVSVREGDTSITFETSEQPDALSSWKSILNRYRRLA